MAISYTSIVYDLNQFGIYNISNAIIGTDSDAGISIDVSFDGGTSFLRNVIVNKRLSVPSSKGKIQFRIKFDDDAAANPYKIKTVGFFSNLEIGTALYFENISTKSVYSTTISENGRYSIYLPKGYYTIWAKIRTEKTILLNRFNPETVILPTQRLDKETAIELYIRDVDWVSNAIYDTFSNEDKKLIGDSIIDIDGDLSDGKTSRKCRWVVIGFE